MNCCIADCGQAAVGYTTGEGSARMAEALGRRSSAPLERTSMVLCGEHGEAAAIFGCPTQLFRHGASGGGGGTA